MTVRLDDLVIPDQLLGVRWDSIGVDRRLVVRSDGSVWLWSLAAAGPGSDQVGTYRIDADPDTVAQVTGLARSVRDSAEPPGGRLGFVLSVGPATEWVPEGGARAGEVTAIIGPLLDRLMDAALAVARWGVAIRLPSSGERRAVFFVSAWGTRAVCLRFDPDSLQLDGVAGAVFPVPAPRMGLVTPEVELLDGLYEPAVLAPGASGACAITLPAESPALVDGAEARWRSGTLTGSVALLGPWSPDGDGSDPMLRFSARSDVHVLG